LPLMKAHLMKLRSWTRSNTRTPATISIGTETVVLEFLQLASEQQAYYQYSSERVPYSSQAHCGDTRSFR
jgi:hypothetical protein